MFAISILVPLWCKQWSFSVEMHEHEMCLFAISQGRWYCKTIEFWINFLRLTRIATINIQNYLKKRTVYIYIIYKDNLLRGKMSIFSCFFLACERKNYYSRCEWLRWMSFCRSCSHQSETDSPLMVRTGYRFSLVVMHRLAFPSTKLRFCIPEHTSSRTA